jgi:hypothetical protein
MNSTSFIFLIPGITTTANANTKPATREQRNVATIKTVSKIPISPLMWIDFGFAQWTDHRSAIRSRHVTGSPLLVYSTVRESPSVL